MYAVRVLSGSQAGQIFMLKEGVNTFGRSNAVNIKLLSPSVSKEHLQIEVFDEKLILTDLNSRNGTFVNGVQVRSTRIKPGDRISINDLIFDVVPSATLARALHATRTNIPQASTYSYPTQGGAARQSLPSDSPQLGPQMQLPDNSPTTNQLLKSEGLSAFSKLAHQYIETVLLPGVYKLPEIFEFKWVLIGFMAFFIVLVTSLSTIPLIRILRASIENESQQHALTIASTLARLNRHDLMQGTLTSLSVESATRRPGVKQAFIISNVDGNVLAPSSKAGSFPDVGFIHEARKSNKEAVQQIDGDTIVAVVPIDFYNSETGTYSVFAHAIVVYDMSTMAVDNGKTLSLFIQTLFIALILGALLFYFLYKLIEHPLKNLNEHIDQALKDGGSNVQTSYQFPVLQKLTANIGSALARMGQDSSMTPQASEYDRRNEMSNLVELIGYAAIAVNAMDRVVYCANNAFIEQTGLRHDALVNAPLSQISDQALKLSLLDLLARHEQNPDQMATNNLEFGGHEYQVAIQGVYGSKSLSYVLFVLVPLSGGS